MADIRVGIIMGSKSDEKVMREGAAVLEKLGIDYEFVVSSAHRNPERTAVWASEAADRGLRVIIAGAGLAAALPGVVAAHTILPVIGVPIASGALNGRFALLHRANASRRPRGDRRHRQYPQCRDAGGRDHRPVRW